jgi:hypothetical protein
MDRSRRVRTLGSVRCHIRNVDDAESRAIDEGDGEPRTPA